MPTPKPTPTPTPEGDAGTGMVATNAVRPRTGNVSAGTSSFSMIVVEKELSKPNEMIDMVTTPDGNLVAMVHCNNCTSELNAWVKMFREYEQLLGPVDDKHNVYSVLYNLNKNLPEITSHCSMTEMGEFRAAARMRWPTPGVLNRPP